MLYCIPTRIGAGVWRNNDARWTVPGSAAWVNDIRDVQFLDMENASTIVVLRNIPDPGSGVVWFRSRVDIYNTAKQHQRVFSEEQLVRSFAEKPQSISRILATPAGLLLAQVVLQKGPRGCILAQHHHSGNLLEGVGPSMATTVGCQLWGDLMGSHPVWLQDDLLAAVPGGGDLLPTSAGSIRIFNLSSYPFMPQLQDSISFRASTWSLTSNLPPSADLNADWGSSSSQRGLGHVSQYASLSSEGMQVYLINPASSLKHWLVEVRVSNASGAAKTYTGTSVQQEYSSLQECNTQTCNGCLSLHLMRLCYAAQQCTLVRCIGTLTNQNRPLCGLGQHIQALFIKSIAGYQRMWDVLVQVLAAMVDISFKNPATGIQIDLLDETFYSVMCPAKDAVASLISVVTATINAVVQKFASYRQRSSRNPSMTSSSVDPNFNAMFTLFATSVNTLINQVALGMFYPLMAAQKVYVCQVCVCVILPLFIVCLLYNTHQPACRFKATLQWWTPSGSM